MKKNSIKIMVLVLILIVPAIVFKINDAEYSLKDLVDYSITDKKRVHENSAYRFLEKDSLRVKNKLKNLDENWEYVKNTLFDHDFDSRRKIIPDRLEGPILIDLNGTVSKEDSLVFKEIINDLREVITTRPIAFFSDFTGVEFNSFKKDKIFKERTIDGYSYIKIVNSTISIEILSKKTIKLINEASAKGENIHVLFEDRKVEGLWHRYRPKTFVKYPLDRGLSFEEKKLYVQYKFLRNLCFTYPLRSRLGPTFSYASDNIFQYKNQNPWNRKFTDKDKFLLKKLYSNKFEEQFSDYLYKAYPKRYANYFIDPGFSKMKVIMMLVLLGVLIFILVFDFFQNKNFKYSYLNYLLPCLVISIYFSNFLNIYLYNINMELTRYLENLGASYLIAIVLSLFYSFLLWGVEKLVIKKRFDFSYKLTLRMLISFIVLNCPLIGYWIIKSYQIVHPNSFSYGIFYLRIFIVTSGLVLLRGLLIYLNHVSKALVKEKELELSRLKEINAQSELKLLQSHINPHFLYNALNSIAGLVHKSPDKSEKMALSLSNLFRYSINKKGQQMSTINEEVVMVQNYLDIEKIRFGQRLTFNLTIDEAIKNKEIPMYILQPLVENAIKHGVSKIRGEGVIELIIKKELEYLLISVSDNGPAFPKGLVSGHGLQTVYDLLRLSYGDKAMLKWENSPVKQISILIAQV